MKKVVTTITAAIFALGLVSAGLAQTAQTPVKPEVKKETKDVAKKDTKKATKKGTDCKDEKKSGAPVEKSQPEKK